MDENNINNEQNEENAGDNAVSADKETNSETLNDLQINANPTKDFFYFVVDLLKTGVIVFIIAFSLRYFVIQPFIVDGESMMSTFVDNEYLLAEKVSYLTGEPNRGDVIVFRYPGNPSVSYIKRVIALPNEKIKISDNKITIINKGIPNGVLLDESSYLSQNTLTLTPGNEDSFEKTLGENEYFVMGDNRQHSSDSREWGVLPKSNILGKAWLTLLPADKFGLSKKINYPNIASALFSFFASKN